jgi:hypothetical protein
VWLFERKPIGVRPTLHAPDRGQAVFCQGWHGATGNGRYMSETHAPFWVYGKVKKLMFAPSDLKPTVTIRKGTAGWSLVTVDVPRLARQAGEKRRVGMRLLHVTTA